jgi:hypothetical protein
MRTVISLAMLAALTIGAAAPARAQQADPRWTPWLGCWEMLDDRTRAGNPEGAEAVVAARQRARVSSASDITVCVTAGARPDTVTLRTRVANEPALEQTLVADAAPHPISEAGCSGSQRAEWSQDGRRLFARAELACAGQPTRTISGLAFIGPDATWLDVQAIEVEGRSNVRVRRYRRAASSSARALGGGPALRIEDVKEAGGKVSPSVLEAALIESGARFALDGRTLTALDGALPDSVIDLMVALSYPDRFQIERRADASLDMSPPGYLDAGWSGLWGLGYPYFSWYPGYYGNYRYYYSPFGYGYSGYYGPYSPYYYYAGPPVENGGTPPAADGDGRVVNGVGYTRIRPREAQTADGGGQSSGGGRSGASSRGRGTVSPGGFSSAGGSSSGGGGGGSSSGGSSGGDGGGGRTAQPR